MKVLEYTALFLFLVALVLLIFEGYDLLMRHTEPSRTEIKYGTPEWDIETGITDGEIVRPAQCPTKLSTIEEMRKCKEWGGSMSLYDSVGGGVNFTCYKATRETLFNYEL